MKIPTVVQRHLFATGGLLAVVLLTGACKKNETVDLSKGFSVKVQEIVPQKIMDDLRAKGLVINEGQQPATLEGIYVISPNTLKASTQTSDVAGTTYTTQRVRLYNQNSTDQSIKLDWKESVSGGNGIGGYVAGNGNLFTVFTESNDTYGATTTYKTLRVYSGELTSAGIKNLQWAFYVKEKNDPGNQVLPVGTTRVFSDGDNLADKATTFRLAARQENASATRESTSGEKP